MIDNVPNTVGGIDPQMFGRNGAKPHAPLMVTVARAINHMLGRHGTVIPGMGVYPELARDSASSNLRLWTTYYRATPNHATLISRVVLLPSVTVGVPSWYVSVDGTPAATQQHNRFGGGSNLSDLFYRDQEIAVTADGAHRLDLYTSDHCRVAGWYCWEKDRETLDSSSDTMADWSAIKVGGGIYDASLEEIVVALRALWQKMRGHHIGFNVTDPASPIAATSTMTNIWDGTTARASDSVGVRCSTRHRGSYLGTTIAVTAWALAERTGGAGDVTVRFAGNSTNTDVVCNNAIDVYTATGTIDVLAANEKVDVQLHAPAGTTGNLYACGMYPYIS